MSEVIVAGLAMMVLALAALLMVVMTSTETDQEPADSEPVAPARDGLRPLAGQSALA
ncbi:hypothetical protein [Kibdelosporangium phytohabitans]|uniref:hypothetical protein n=1 Tax=Kibdelosporangium phytohabitans TaxID=860235 RepID=UPI0012F97C06|nr:hypothetical protein [Kibdelosporangium phytohabitans]MBE1466615.1 hypothetical protein [Kibdelosporangium phytohabitans]